MNEVYKYEMQIFILKKRYIRKNDAKCFIRSMLHGLLYITPIYRTNCEYRTKKNRSRNVTVSPITNHQLPITKITNHQSPKLPITKIINNRNHQNHQSSITNHQSPKSPITKIANHQNHQYVLNYQKPHVS